MMLLQSPLRTDRPAPDVARRLETLTIDIHAHAMPDGIGAVPPTDRAARLAWMDAVGLDLQVLSSPGDPAVHRDAAAARAWTRAMQDWVAGAEARFRVATALPWGPVAEVIAALKAAGPLAQLALDRDDPALTGEALVEVTRAAAALDVRLLLHVPENLLHISNILSGFCTSYSPRMEQDTDNSAPDTRYLPILCQDSPAGALTALAGGGLALGLDTAVPDGPALAALAAQHPRAALFLGTNCGGPAGEADPIGLLHEAEALTQAARADIAGLNAARFLGSPPASALQAG